jgi:hypothetical protein
MPNMLMVVLSVILFFALVPGILFRIPLSSLYAEALAHAFIFGIIVFFFSDMFSIFSNRMYLDNL